MVGRRHRPQGRFRRRALALRAVVPPSAPLSPHLQHLPSLVGVPELRRRGADGGDRRRAQLRGDAGGRPDLRHLRRVPHRHGRRRRSTARRPSWCSRATRCAWRLPPSAAASSSTRAPRRLTKDRARPHGVPEARRRGAASTSARSRSAMRELLADDPQLESRPTFLFFKGAASGLFAEGAKQLQRRRQRSAGAAHRHQVRARLAQVLQALRRAVRGLRRQADLPRVRRRGARAPRPADPRVPRAARPPGAAARAAPRRPAPARPRAAAATS